MSQVKLLGHLISQGGVVVDLSKVEVLLKWEGPKNASEVRSFLGITFTIGDSLGDSVN